MTETQLKKYNFFYYKIFFNKNLIKNIQMNT